VPGFGGWPFGSEPFGAFPWSKQVLWRDLPEIDRYLDQTEADGRLEKFIDAIRPSFDELLGYVQDFGSLRDPDTVRTQYQRRIDVNLLTAYPTANGRTIEVLIENTDTSDPFVPLGETSIGWILEDEGGREYTVNSVHKLWSEGPMIELKGAAVLPVSSFSEGGELTGFVTFTRGSATVTGSGTVFLAGPPTGVTAGQYLSPSAGGGYIGKVANVVDNTTITLAAPWNGPTTTNVVAIAMTAADGPAVLRPPAMISNLGADFGIDVDQYEPESFQRSSVRNAKQWLIRKGAQRGYDIIGKISGYRVVAYPLWRVPTPPPAWLLPSEVYTIDGNSYTSVDPFLPLFDEIAADVIPLDYACRETPNWTSDAITPPVPSPPDGMSVEEAIGFVMEGLPISAAPAPVDLGGGRWRIRVGPGVDLWPIGVIGAWYANFTTMTGTFYLETKPVEVTPGNWEFEIVAGESPTFGTTLSIDYECHLVMDCNFCRASALRIEATGAEVMSEPAALEGDPMGRLSRKILQAVPAHVRTTDIVHVVSLQLPLNPSVQVQTSSP
jgi:hypothetical protein